MKKRGSKRASSRTGSKDLNEELKAYEDKTAFRLFNYNVKKRHVFSFATLMFIFSLSLRTFDQYVQQGREPGNLTVLIMFVISLAIILLLIIRKHRQWRVQHNLKNIMKRTATLYLVTCVVIGIFSLVNLGVKGSIFPSKEFIFILSISIVFSTITLDTV